MDKSEFEVTAMSLLRTAISELEPKFKRVTFVAAPEQGNEWSRSIVLSAIFADSDPDLLQLVLSFLSLENNIDKMNAVVSWGHDSLYVEADYSWEFVDVTPENLEHMLAGLPKLIDAFKVAVSRGCPPS